jgi:hypothetical protein
MPCCAWIALRLPVLHTHAWHDRRQHRLPCAGTFTHTELLPNPARSFTNEAVQSYGWPSEPGRL